MKKILIKVAKVLCVLLTVIAVLATVLPLLPSKQWYVRVFDYPRLQTLFLSLAAFILYLVLFFEKRKRGIILLSGLAILVIIQAYKAFPYTPLAGKQVIWSQHEDEQRTISLFISNVLQTNTAYDQVLEKIETYKPDIVITTESDREWQKGLAPLNNVYFFRVPIPQDNTYGMHLYSKLPLKETQVRYLLEAAIPSIRTQVQLRSGKWIHLFIVHPRPPVPGEASDSKERDAEIIMVAKEARKEKGGVIVAGDFNDVAWSETTELFQEVSGYLDPRRGRGFYNTFHAKYPVFRWPLDHIFHSSHFKLLNIERVDAVNSDHFPMYIKLSYEPEDKAAQPEVKKENDTEEDAEKTIQKGKSDTEK